MVNIGPVMLDIDSTALSSEDKQILANDLVGGVILFRRNFESAAQIFELTQAIRELNPSIIIAVDQEGGRVQRFTNGFSKLPPLAMLGELYQHQPEESIGYAHDLGELMAIEIQAVGCDISFAPVLDLGNPESKVIGDRAFSIKLDEIIILGTAYIQGMADAGMGATGKHFPGHGSVEADSHVSIPYDRRAFKQIQNNDLQAFSQLASILSAIMPAHIIYPEVDQKPAGFSPIWLQKILRQELGFDGVIFSDDLSMKGAEVVGGFEQRAVHALEAGCDMVLVCNNRQAAIDVLVRLEEYKQTVTSQIRLSKLLMQQPASGLQQLQQTNNWKKLSNRVEQFKQLALQ